MVSSLLGALYSLNRAPEAPGQYPSSEHEFARYFGSLRVAISRTSRWAARAACPRSPKRFSSPESVQDFINDLAPVCSGVAAPRPAHGLGPRESGRHCRLVLPACQGLRRSGKSTVEARRPMSARSGRYGRPAKGTCSGKLRGSLMVSTQPPRWRSSTSPPRNSCAADGADRSDESRTGDGAHPSTCAHGGT